MPDIWFPGDLARILASKRQAADRWHKEDDYWHGYLDALADLAVEFGVTMGEPAVYEVRAERMINTRST